MKTITKAIFWFFAVIIVLAIIGAMVAPPEPTPEEELSEIYFKVEGYKMK